MKKDYIVTFSAEFLVLFSAILVYKLAAHFLGKDGFAEYALGMKTAALIHPVLLLGLGVGIPRYMAYSLEKKRADSYFIAGAAGIACMFFLFLLAINIFQDFFAFLLFGESSYGYLISPLCLILAGLLFHSVCYSYFRGSVRMFPASLLRSIHGTVPLFVLFFVGASAVSTMTAIGTIWIFVSLVALFIISRSLKFHQPTLVSNVKELLNFGVRRVPADIGMAAILVLPATLTAHIAGVQEAGFVAFGISILSISSGLFAPIGLVLLPRASRLISKGDFHNLNKEVVRVLITSVIAGIIITGFFVVFAEAIITIYLGESFIEVARILKIAAIGVLPFTVYVCMRSIIDAFHVKAKNTQNVLISFGVFLVSSSVAIFFSKDYFHVLFSLIASLFILGILTTFEVRSIGRSLQK